MIKKCEYMGTPPSDTGQQPPARQMGKGGPNTQSYDYTRTLEATVNAKSGTKNIEKKTISNSTSDQNTVLVQKNGILNIIDYTLKKTEDVTSDDNANFYGLDSVVLTNGKSCCYCKEYKNKFERDWSKWYFCN